MAAAWSAAVIAAASGLTGCAGGAAGVALAGITGNTMVIARPAIAAKPDLSPRWGVIADTFRSRQAALPGETGKRAVAPGSTVCGGELPEEVQGRDLGRA
ncbi:hypothetical protein GCM10009754_76800 [Amycolatopsis minnesotensis]|uniref:Uncharacterized protein n=1 Tax=Amycolatopsis minnesotensis TaxID=337894 RepID=A0ABP5DW74_9PSEU